MRANGLTASSSTGGTGAFAQFPYMSTLGDNIGQCQLGASAVATDIVALANQTGIDVSINNVTKVLNRR